MAQEILTYAPSPLAGGDFVAETIKKLQSLASCRSGALTPDDVQENEIWVQQAENSTVRIVFIRSNGADVKIGEVDTTTGVFTASGASEATTDTAGTVLLAESINDLRALATPSAAIVQEAIRNQAGAYSMPVYYPGEWKDFHEQVPPAGWAERNGALLAAADANFPELWAELQKPEHAWKLKTETEWQALAAATAAASPYAMGGVGYFVLDTTAKTIRLPDTRTDFLRHSQTPASIAGDGLRGVGEWQGDAIRNITGDVGWQYAAAGVQQASPTSALYYNHVGDVRTTLEAGNGYDHVVLDASRSVPTAPENRPRNIAVLGCVCVNPPLASRNEATTTTLGGVCKYDESLEASDPLNQRDSVFVTPAQAAMAAAPDDHYYDLPVMTAIQTAEYASGYISMSASISTNSAIIVSIVDDDSNVLLKQSCTSDNAGTTSAGLTIRIGKGNNFRYSYFGTIDMVFFRFFYDVGSYEPGNPNDNPKYEII